MQIVVFAVVQMNAACQMWNYVSSYMHLRNCLRIAAEARSEGKSWNLALGYDELCRKKWAEKAVRGEHFSTFIAVFELQTVRFSSGDPGFDVNVVSQERDEEMLNRARVEWKEPKKKTGRLHPPVSLEHHIICNIVTCNICIWRL